ncbi:putative cytokinetic ring protein SteA [Demequina sp. SYSU T00192]|uniref:Cytokinetic ring protein SteA n=1 Tax=Demequina litoralis TaxID=3051660 RepID=A0ABT8GE87_9MICO|nr:putative cytokinetic ring protein SteA [Demequina sp. SYSU T00192]MDN4476989.1 putative cytokinetic ring protein SteA [Demequina sp. SYSU T00192]
MTAAITAISGPARVDSSPLVLARRLQPGDVAIVDALDLDKRAAAALAARRPAAVVNAQPCLSGRLPTTGALVLLEAGIPVVESAGAEVLAIRDGAAVTVEGARVAAGARVLEDGTRLSLEDVEHRIRVADEDLHVHVASFTATALDLLNRDADLLLDGIGLPELRLPVDGRPVVVVTPRFTGGDEVLARFARERRPIVIGVGEGADAAKAAGLMPRIVVGDIDAVGEELLRRAAQVIVHDPVGRDAGVARAHAIGLSHDACDARLASEDVALLAAHAAGASVIVVAGARDGLLDYVEDRSTAGAGALLSRLVASGRVVDSGVLPALYRHRYSAWTAWGAVGLAAGALLLAAWGTPEGHDALAAAGAWLADTFGGGR